VDGKSVIGSVDEELADVLIYFCAIANRLGIDLEPRSAPRKRSTRLASGTADAVTPVLSIGNLGVPRRTMGIHTGVFVAVDGPKHAGRPLS